jgi:hypothetical protein
LEHDRDDLRYPSDLTDAEWAVLSRLAQVLLVARDEVS